MTLLPLIFFGLFLLYLTRRKMTVELSKLVNRFGGGKRTFIWLWSLIFLPGTIIHEVSHFLAAALTGAKTGKIEIFPELSKNTLGGEFDRTKKTHRLGFVQTQQLNPIRGFIVGIAPLLIGMGLLIWLAPELQVTSYKLQVSWQTAIKFYLFFTVANSLFLSWTDVKQTLPLIIIGIILGGILWLIGVQVKIGPESPVWNIAKSLGNALWISVGINAGIDVVLWMVNKLRI